LNADFPWPKSGDRLLKSGGQRTLAAHTLSNVGEVGLVAAGFKDAGDALIESIDRHGRNDGLTLPILFCYRQYVELKLKEIIEKVHRFEETGDSYRRTHNIGQLWEAVKVDVIKNVADEEAESIEVVERCLMEIHELDERGDALRYPTPLHFTQIDLGNLKAVIENISAFLDALADQWDDGIAYKF